MARGFGATLGAGTTDAINTGLTSHATQRTWAIAFNRNGIGGGTGGRLFHKQGTSDAETEFLTWLDASLAIRFQRNFAASSVRWDLDLAVTNTPYYLVIRYNSSSTANNITAFSAGTSITATRSVGGTPSGTANTNTAPYTLGNRPADNLRSWDGTIAEFAVWNELIPDDVAIAISKGFGALVYPKNLIYYAPLIREAIDIKGGLVQSVTGTAVQPHPRVVYTAARQGFSAPDAGSGIAGSGALQARTSLGGAGTIRRQSNGSVSSRTSLTGAGSITRRGSGGLQQRTSVSGSGVRTIAGAGQLNTRSSISGAGTITRVGSGTLNGRASLSGAGAIARIGSGSISARTSIGGIGAINGAVSGTGSIGTRAAITGAGTITRIGGGTTQARTSLTGAGSITRLGTGGIQSTASLSGTGAIARIGSGSISTRLAIAGLGVLRHQGTGAIGLLTGIAGTGLTDGGSPTGNGAIAFASQVAGAGTVTRVGAGAFNVRTRIIGGGSNGEIQSVPPLERTLTVPRVSRTLLIP